MSKYELVPNKKLEGLNKTVEGSPNVRRASIKVNYHVVNAGLDAIISSGDMFTLMPKFSVLNTTNLSSSEIENVKNILDLNNPKIKKYLDMPAGVFYTYEASGLPQKVHGAISGYIMLAVLKGRVNRRLKLKVSGTSATLSTIVDQVSKILSGSVKNDTLPVYKLWTDRVEASGKSLYFNLKKLAKNSGDSIDTRDAIMREVENAFTGMKAKIPSLQPVYAKDYSKTAPLYKMPVDKSLAIYTSIPDFEKDDPEVFWTRNENKGVEYSELEKMDFTEKTWDQNWLIWDLILCLMGEYGSIVPDLIPRVACIISENKLVSDVILELTNCLIDAYPNLIDKSPTGFFKIAGNPTPVYGPQLILSSPVDIRIPISSFLLLTGLRGLSANPKVLEMLRSFEHAESMGKSADFLAKLKDELGLSSESISDYLKLGISSFQEQSVYLRTAVELLPADVYSKIATFIVFALLKKKIGLEGIINSTKDTTIQGVIIEYVSNCLQSSDIASTFQNAAGIKGFNNFMQALKGISENSSSTRKQAMINALDASLVQMGLPKFNLGTFFYYRPLRTTIIMQSAAYYAGKQSDPQATRLLEFFLAMVEHFGPEIPDFIPTVLKQMNAETQRSGSSYVLLSMIELIDANFSQNLLEEPTAKFEISKNSKKPRKSKALSNKLLSDEDTEAQGSGLVGSFVIGAMGVSAIALAYWVSKRK